MTAVATPTLTVDEILADTQAFGFVFFQGSVKKERRPLGEVPLIRVTDSPVFDRNFPGVILTASNGTSIKVSSQRIGRDYAYNNLSQPKDKRDAKIQRLNVEWLLGIKTSAPQFPGPEDEMYATKEEAKAAWLEWASQQ